MNEWPYWIICALWIGLALLAIPIGLVLAEFLDRGIKDIAKHFGYPRKAR